MNILVEVVGDVPHARIANFGITTVTKNLDSTGPETRHDFNSPRWSAPEVIYEQDPSKKSDVYSFAMVIIEVHREWSQIRSFSANCRLTNAGTHR